MHIVLVAAGVVALAAFFVGGTLRAKARRRQRIAAAFGKPPEGHRGLAVAEDFLIALSKHRPHPATVDDLTWGDLGGDDVFFRLNGCQSAAGDVRLYAAMRRLPQNPAGDGTLAAREDMIALFAENPALRLDVQCTLAALGRTDGAGMEMTAFRADTFALPGRWLYRLMALLPLLSIGAFWFGIAPGLLALMVAVSTTLNAYNFAKRRNEGSFCWVRYMAACITCAGRLRRLLAAPCPALAVRLAAATKGLAPLRGSVAMLNFNHTVEEAVDFDPSSILLLPVLSYGKLAAKMPDTGEEMLALYTLLGEIDMAIAVLSWRQSLPWWCAPEYTDEKRLAATALYHPLLENPVPNDAAFCDDVLLTGSNASGKSTFIKAVALGCLLGQSLGTCCAERFVMKPGFVATSMAVADSVVDGDSYFVAEIKSMRRLVQMSPPANADAPAESENTTWRPAFAWFFIDEILKGTNTVERIAAASAVLHQLHAAPCLCFAATHDMELCGILAGAYDNWHFRETVEDGGVFFDYRLQQGPAKSRNAILLLGQMGFPNAVCENARGLVARFEEDGEWAGL